MVFGAGMVGLGAVAGSRLQGAARIIVVDLSEDRLALAKQHGATDTWIGGDDTVDRVLEETDGFGADFTSRRRPSSASCARRSSRLAWVGHLLRHRRRRQGRDPRHRPALPDHRP